MPFDPVATALGRGVIVAAGADAPAPWRHSPRVRIDNSVLAQPDPVVAELHSAWANRVPVVVELAVDRAALIAPEVDAREPYELSASFTFTREQLYFLVRANNYDARTQEPRWWPTTEAERLGAVPGGPADVVLADGTPAWLDGGPRGTATVPEGHVVVHRSHLDLGSLVPDHPTGVAAAVRAQLAPDQLRAVAHPGGPARIIAPAGSGKTRVLTERLRHLLRDRRWDPRQVVALAYNVRAREEMVARTHDVVGASGSILTLNAFALRIVAAARPHVRVAEEREVRDRIRALVRINPRRDTDALAPYLDALTEIRLGLRDPELVEDDRGDVDGLAQCFAAFHERMTQDNVVDFDGMIYEAIRILLTDPHSRAAAQRHTRHLLVDEFQDLTPAHLLLVRLLAAPAFDVFGVGDDDQVIYGYNGADPDFLVRYGHYFPGAHEHALEVNYRCPAPVVSAASTLLTHNRVRVPKAIRTPRRDGALVVHEVPTGDLSTIAIQTVTKWVELGTPADQIAVLSRVNASLLSLQVLLADRGIATNRPLTARVLERTGTRTALAYLRVATAVAHQVPISGSDLALCAARPHRKIPRPVREQISRRRQWTTASLAKFADSVAGHGGSAGAVDGLVRLVNDCTTVGRLARRAPVAEVLAHVRDLVADGLRALERSGRGPEASHLDDIDALIAAAAVQPDIDRFEPWLREHLATATAPDTAAAVTLASVHKVKGMEWDRVVVLGAHDGLMPHRLAHDVEEERRVFHVAITRSREATVVIADRDTPRQFLAESAEARDPNAPEGPARVATEPARSRPSPAPVDLTGLGPDDDSRVRALKDWRKTRARTDGVPAFVVLNDRHLVAIATAAPATLNDLAECPGIGPAKLERYGEEILATIEPLLAVSTPPH